MPKNANVICEGSLTALQKYQFEISIRAKLLPQENMTMNDQPAQFFITKTALSTYCPQIEMTMAAISCYKSLLCT